MRPKELAVKVKKPRARVPWTRNDNFIFREDQWRREKTVESSNFTTFHYYCTSKCNTSCPFIFKKDVRRDDGRCSFYTAYEHSEACLESSHNFSTTHPRAAILRECESQVMPKAWDVKTALEGAKDENGNRKYPQIDIKYLYGVMGSLKKKASIASSMITTDHIEEKCSLYLHPSESCEPWVLGTDTDPMRVLISSQDLLNKTSSSRIMHIDGTYKLTTCNYPIVVIGFSDLDGKFFLSAIGVIETESEASYTWVLEKFKTGMRNLNLSFNPEVAVADNSSAISAAVAHSFPGIKRVNCWFHVKKNLKELIASNPPYIESFSHDVDFLQLLPNPILFDQGLDLFFEKWAKIPSMKKILKSFEKNYTAESNRNWFEGYDLFSPSTNNCVERFNRTIKSRYAGYTKFNLLRFIDVETRIVKDCNADAPSLIKMKYNEPNLIHVPEKYTFYPLVTNQSKRVLVFDTIARTDSEIARIRAQFNSNSFNFDGFKKFYETLVYLTVKEPLNHWKCVYCSCRNFVKDKKCMHVFLYLKQIKRTDLININLLITRKARGRPKKLITPGSALSKNNV